MFTLRSLRLGALLPLLAAAALHADSPNPVTPVDKAAMAAQVKAGCLHAWNGYKQYAWGHDALLPLSKKSPTTGIPSAS